MIAILCVAVSPSILAQPVSDDTGGQSRADKAQEKPQTDKTPLILEAIQHSIERVAGAIEAQKDEADANTKDEREKSDLEAQWQMARWAENAVHVAIGALALTIIGVFLIWRTLVHTRRAADSARDMVIEGENATKAAQEAAREAKRQADLAEKTFQTIQRPYVYVYGVTEMAPFDAGKRLPYVVANHGQTPAIIRHVFAGLSVGDEPGSPCEVIEYHPLRVKPILDSKESRRCFDEGHDLHDSGARVVVFQSESGGITSIVPEIPAGKKLFFRVDIIYDGPGTHRPTAIRSFRTSACWYYHPDINQFVLYGGGEYNYNR